MNIAEFTRRHVVRAGALREGAGAVPAVDVTAHDFAYVERAPGRALESDGDAGATLLIVMTGHWAVSVAAAPPLAMERWDTLVVPPGQRFEASNTGEALATLMTIRERARADQ